MTTEQDDPSEEDQTLACHRAFAEVLKGERPMAWSDWAMIIDESKCLTTGGKQVVFWAVDTLRQTLQDDFLQRAQEWLAKMQAKGDPDLAPRSHPHLFFGSLADLRWPLGLCEPDPFGGLHSPVPTRGKERA